MKRLIDSHSAIREGNQTNQTHELNLTTITAILDLVCTGDLSQRINASELGASTQIQQLAKEIYIIIDNYESACKGTTLGLTKVLSAGNEDLKVAYDQNEGSRPMNLHYAPITLHFHETSYMPSPTICPPTISDRPLSTIKRESTQVISSLSTFPIPYLYKEHMVGAKP